MNQIENNVGGFTVANGKKGPGFREAMWFHFLLGACGVYLWWLVYGVLPQLSRFLTYSLFNIGRGTHLGAALEFFFYDTPKVMMLLVLVVFGVGIIRTFFTPERTRDILSGKSEFVGNVMAASLGIVTPFCSCSAVPLFIGFVTAGVPLGVTFSFLIAAPLVNEIAVGLLYGLLGWKVAGIYMATGLTIAIMAGWVIGRMHLEKYIEEWVVKLNVDTAAAPQIKMVWRDRITAGWEAVKEIVGKVWIYMIIGIAVGAGIHGYVPEGFMASIMGKGAWWAVPAAVGMGVPMYSNAAGIIPVVEALLGKGAALGTVLAFMMSVIALSLPEMIILRKILKPQLIAVFITVVTCGILIVGYLFNILI
ncbi:permease [uncultured Desulfosarcina sp.]|uniref:permease n=1 Tax=uncultured Desulfosarcina sp. TaxID=218289 RepID=UPI0029C99772|nr:permease [uncultured Desulfosarcina sp.]